MCSRITQISPTVILTAHQAPSKWQEMNKYRVSARKFSLIIYILDRNQFKFHYVAVNPNNEKYQIENEEEKNKEDFKFT